MEDDNKAIMAVLKAEHDNAYPLSVVTFELSCIGYAYKAPRKKKVIRKMPTTIFIATLPNFSITSPA